MRACQFDLFLSYHFFLTFIHIVIFFCTCWTFQCLNVKCTYLHFSLLRPSCRCFFAPFLLPRSSSLPTYSFFFLFLPFSVFTSVLFPLLFPLLFPFRFLCTSLRFALFFSPSVSPYLSSYIHFPIFLLIFPVFILSSSSVRLPSSAYTDRGHINSSGLLCNALLFSIPPPYLLISHTWYTIGDVTRLSPLTHSLSLSLTILTTKLFS